MLKKKLTALLSVLLIAMALVSATYVYAAEGTAKGHKKFIQKYMYQVFFLNAF